MSDYKDDVRMKALASAIKEDAEDISPEGDNRFSVGRREYLVLTDSEADESAEEYIKDSLWAFNSDFICGHIGLPELSEALQAFQEQKCEDANDTIFALVNKMGRFDQFVSEAISADGRGHFMSTYDGEELEETIQVDEDDKETFYIYRTN